MSIILSDFASKVQYALDHHLVRVKAGEQGILQIEIVATSAQTYGQHSVSQVALTPAVAPGAMRQGDIAYTQAMLLQAIGKYYCLNTDVEAKVQGKNNLARFDPSAPDAIKLPNLPQGETIKPLTCRDVKNIIRYAKEQAPKSRNLDQLLVDVLREVISHLDRETLFATAFASKTLGTLAFPEHAVHKAGRVQLLALNERTPLFRELFQFFTGVEDIEAWTLAEPRQDFHFKPDGPNTISKGLAALATQIEHLPTKDRLSYFNAVLKYCESLHDSLRSDVLAALAGQICTLPVSDRKEAFEAIHAEAATLEPGDRSPVLAALAGQIRSLPLSERKAKFDLLFDIPQGMADKNAGPIIGGLSSQISSLHPALHQSYFDMMFAATKALAREHQSGGLAGLAYQFSVLPFAQIPAYVDKILAANALLPGKDQGQAFDELVWLIDYLARHKSSGTLSELLDKLFNANVQRDREYQSDGLVQLAPRLARLVSQHALPLFNRILGANSLLAIEKQGPTVQTLIEQFLTLPVDAYGPCFQNLFDAVTQLPLDQRAEKLTLLQDHTQYLLENKDDWNLKISEELLACVQIS